MSFYVNPITETKETFLEREGSERSVINWNSLKEDELPVVLMENFMFSAAGVAYCKEELRQFTLPEDTRPKRYFVVPIDKLIPVTNEGLKEAIKK